MQRPVDDPPASAPTAQGAAAGEEGAAATAAGHVDEAPAEGAGSESAEEGESVASDEGDSGPVSRVPTASEMLGLGRSAQGSAGSGDLPPFIQARGEGSGASPLFSGRAVEPSPNYQRLRVSLSEASPMERHWGRDGAANQPEPTAQRAPGTDPTNPFFAGNGEAADPEDDEGGAGARETSREERRFRLVMYRLGANGQVETLERAFSTREAREAALSHASRQGYRTQRPSEEEIGQARSAGQPAAQPEAAQAQEDECRFRAYWTEGSVRQSRCFASQEALDAFTEQRRTQQQQQQQQEAQQPSAPGTESGGSLQPVQLGE